MPTTTRWDPYDNELETLVMKLKYHARFLTSAAYAIHAGVPYLQHPARHNPEPLKPARRLPESCWGRNG